MPTELFIYNNPFVLQSGKSLPSLRLAYTKLGNMNADKTNIIWIFHALTADSNPQEWWSGLVGIGKLFTPEKYCIICVNMPGSCYGSSNALDINEGIGKPFYHSFPWFTIKDMVSAYKLLQAHLGITKIWLGLGGSMGGQQLLQWASEAPNLFSYIIPLCTNAVHSSWGKAFNAAQRICIENDVTWNTEQPIAGLNGMKAARSIALLSYRHYNTYEATQIGVTKATEYLPKDEQVFMAETYQKYQGEKLAKRFNAFSYYALTKGMDSHNIATKEKLAEEILQTITAKTLVIGITTDILFPVSEQAFIANSINHAKLIVIDSLYGHDGFLLEFDAIETAIITFLNN